MKIFTMQWEGPIPGGLAVSVVNTSGLSNRRRNMNFHTNMQTQIRAEGYDAVVGFNKLPDLDVYYAADVCFKARTANRSGLYKATSRYRHFIAWEQAVFATDARTEILLLAEAQKGPYVQEYGTPEARFHVLPPDIAPDRFADEYDLARRIEARQQLNIPATDLVVLMVGSGFKTKGVDRALRAIASLPAALLSRVHLWVAGQDEPRAFLRLARTLKIADHVKFLGGRDDIPTLLLGADLLIHPAYHENTGNALLEAMAYGLPVLATDVCGYAPHVAKANAGLLVPSPFSQEDFDRMLRQMLSSDERSSWGRNGCAYIRSIDLKARVKNAVDIIENQARRRIDASH